MRRVYSAGYNGHQHPAAGKGTARYNNTQLEDFQPSGQQGKEGWSGDKLAECLLTCN